MAFSPSSSIFANKYSYIQTFYTPRKKLPNPYISSDGRPKLVCVVGEDLEKMLHTGLEALGGLGRLVNSNQHVLIKPNLVLRESHPDNPQYPTTSSPDCIVRLIEELKSFTNHIRVGDQGAEEQELIYDRLDLRSKVDSTGADLINFTQMDNPIYIVRNIYSHPPTHDYRVYSAVYDSPVIINLCSLKRHSSAYMTCAIKNNIGAIEGRWNSSSRGYLHRHPNLSELFLESLPDVAHIIKPELTVVDARDIMIGNGPALSFPGAAVKKGINKILISGDMVAVDSYCAERIMQNEDPGFFVDSIHPTLKKGEMFGLGTSDLNKVEIFEIDEEWKAGGKTIDRKR